MLGHFEEALTDLQVASKLDYELLNEVKPKEEYLQTHLPIQLNINVCIYCRCY